MMPWRRGERGEHAPLVDGVGVSKSTCKGETEELRKSEGVGISFPSILSGVNKPELGRVSLSPSLIPSPSPSSSLCKCASACVLL